MSMNSGCFYHHITKSFQSKDFDKSTYPSLVRVLCSEFGYKFLKQSNLFETKVTEILQFMDSKRIKLRKRTLSPIIQSAWRENISHVGMSIFSLSQVNNIILDSTDLCCLLESGSVIDHYLTPRDTKISICFHRKI